jgi:uncharacterized protein with FMN-binding domain
MNTDSGNGTRVIRVLLFLVLLPPVAGTASADTIELLSGASIEGKVTNIDKEKKEITFSRVVGSRSYERVYSYDKLHAVTLGDKRYVLNAMPAGSVSTPSPRSTTDSSKSNSGDMRSKAEIDALIDQMGSKPPDWYESTPLNYPKTLDLSWPQKPPGEWNSQRNVGQFLWDVINPNTGRWREGIRFMHHMLQYHKDDPEKLARAMQELGRMYHDFEEDYARAAFWWRKAGLERARQSPASVKLAQSYWKLGNKQMAVELLNRLPIYSNTIKLWADMGETSKALQLSEAYARAGYSDIAYLYAGDACRILGRYNEAIDYYEKVLKTSATGQAAKRIQRNQSRARANIEGIKVFDSLDISRIADGTYQGSCLGYAGDVNVVVVVRSGRIESVAVTSHKEKQFYSALTATPKQIVAKQGLKGIDAVSGATITSEAIINATARALASGSR